MSAAAKKISVKQIRSTIGRERSQLATLKSLGLGRIGRVVEHNANPAIVGMLRKVSHLVEVRAVGRDAEVREVSAK